MILRHISLSLFAFLVANFACAQKLINPYSFENGLAQAMEYARHVEVEPKQKSIMFTPVRQKDDEIGEYPTVHEMIEEGRKGVVPKSQKQAEEDFPFPVLLKEVKRYLEDK